MGPETFIATHAWNDRLLIDAPWNDRLLIDAPWNDRLLIDAPWNDRLLLDAPMAVMRTNIGENPLFSFTHVDHKCY